MEQTRRRLLHTATWLALGRPAWMPRLAFAPPHSTPAGDLLVCVFLRGAADGLNMVVPHGDADYYRLRPTLGIPRPDDRRNQADLRTRDLDGFFGLHPALAALLPAWQDRRLALVHACGAPDESRSHFQAMELIERGVSALTGPASGWISRHLAALDTGNHSPLRAISLSEQLPRSLQGAVPATALRSVADFHLGGDLAAAAQMRAALRGLYHDQTPLAGQGLAALDVLSTLEQLDAARYRPASGVTYPASEFGAGLRQIAMLAKAEIGLEVACLDMDGWDTHIAQGGSVGLMAGLLADLAAGLAALDADLHAQQAQLTVVVQSEFGRRVGENGGLGTDHGHGGVMLLLGGGLRGGRVYGTWPGLAPEQLIGPGDLAVTTDYRDVLGEIVQHRLNNPRLEAVFPGYTPAFLGVVEQPNSTGK